MMTFSLCMIVKNEEAVLARCLDSLADLMDEIIIVDTGSKDHTREIASCYTSQVYDFPWNGDFSAARNFSFSKARMDYIYAPDADEVLDEENRRRLARLKEVLLPEVEIVQMKYRTLSEYDTVLNAASEYRPKLFKRLRSFTWVDPIHETIRLEPVVFDSDIEILHMPTGLHSRRDFGAFERLVEMRQPLSEKLMKMYATELFKRGEIEDLQRAQPYWETVLETDTDPEHIRWAVCILGKSREMQQQPEAFFAAILKDMGQTPCSEVCYLLGLHFAHSGNAREASLWFYNAAFETSPVLDIHAGGDDALQALIGCYEQLAADDPASEEGQYFMQQAQRVRQQLADWSLPEES